MLESHADKLELEGNNQMAVSPCSRAQACSTIGVTEKRIRDANQKKGEALAGQFRPRVRGIEDPKVGQTKMKTVEGSVVLLRQFTPLWAFKKVFVTPFQSFYLSASQATLRLRNLKPNKDVITDRRGNRFNELFCLDSDCRMDIVILSVSRWRMMSLLKPGGCSICMEAMKATTAGVSAACFCS
jgi:hypothetical protein